MSTTPAVPPRLTDDAPGGLQQRLDTLRKRYGRQHFTSPGNRLEVAANRRRFQLTEIRKQIAELEQRQDVIESELRGLGKGMAALIGEEIARYEAVFPEAWSPAPVLGYRLWTIDEGALVGARQIWEVPVYVATCADHPGREEIPHTDERCGRLGCGVYATKDLNSLLEPHVRQSDRNYLAGVVAMTGKVVEHDEGYRAARAEVVSIALIGRNREVYTAETGAIEAAFHDPLETLHSSWSRPLRAPVLAHIKEHLSKRMDIPWISANANE